MVNTKETQSRIESVQSRVLNNSSMSPTMRMNIEKTERSIKYIVDFFRVNGIDEAVKYLKVKAGNIITIGQDKYKIQAIKNEFIKIVSMNNGNPSRIIKLDELKFLISQGQFLPLNKFNPNNEQIHQRRKTVNQAEKNPNASIAKIKTQDIGSLQLLVDLGNQIV